MSRRVVISGCSGGGKSTLLAELGRRGYPVVEEPGRRIVREQRVAGGSALPWVDPISFLKKAFDQAEVDLLASTGALTFFDRSLVDAALGLARLSGTDAASLLERRPRYHPVVFVAPPWPEIYVNDSERQHSYQSAVLEYDQLLTGYPQLGYDVQLLPKLTVSERADFMLSVIRSTWE